MIGIFDSGIGGLGTTSAIRKKAPHADIVYFGDLANMPYGPRPTEELFHLTLDAMMFLRAKGATEFVAACNSVSVSVITPITDVFGTSQTRIIEMVGPAARALARHTSEDHILVIATIATVRSGIYERAFQQQGLSVEMLAVPLLASAIEREVSSEEVQHIIAPAIQKAISIQAKTLVFGCTQFPFVREEFVRAFSEREYKIDVFDPSDAVADEAVTMFDVSGSGTIHFYVSKSSNVFSQTVRELFGDTVQIECVNEISG